MGEIVFGRREHDFRVAGHLDLARSIAVVGDRQAAHFHVVLRRYHDLELGFEIAVAAAEGRLVELERGLVLVGFAAHRQVGRRPDLARPRIAQIDEVRAGVRGAIFASARH